MISISDNTYTLIGIVISFASTLIAFLKWRFAFWKRHGFPSAEKGTSLIGLFKRDRSIGQIFADIYAEGKSARLRHIGGFLFIKPVYVPLDPEIIKPILTTDFANFVNRGMFFDEKNDPLSAHLFSIEDDTWRSLRQKLSPTFTSGQMKMMFQTLADCGERLRHHMNTLLTMEAVDIKDVLARFTTDNIGSCAFGIECNTIEDPDAEFRKYGRIAFDNNLVQDLRMFAMFAFPRNLLRIFHFSPFSSDVNKFFY